MTSPPTDTDSKSNKTELPELLDFEKSKLDRYQIEINQLLKKDQRSKTEEKNLKARQKIYHKELKKIHHQLTHWERSLVARHKNRPYMLDYISVLFEDFIELHGDRKFADDPSFVCGFAKFKGQSLCVVGNQKDHDEPIQRNFGMGNPEGYRKALRIFKLAEKFKKPIITFIDTPGANPGKEGEDRGQGEAIACNLKEMFSLNVPIICIVIGEGGSGGALGIGIGDYVMMLENSIYSVISPESFASIIWHDVNRKEAAAEALKNGPKTALKFGLIDEIIKEPLGGAHRNWTEMMKQLDKTLTKVFKKLIKIDSKKLLEKRRIKFASMGEFSTRSNHSK